MSMKRIDTWDMALHEHVESRVGKPFEWGSNDCALFVCDGIQAMTGTDVAGDFRGKYTDQAGALATIKAVTGGSSVEDVAVHVTAEQGMAELKTVLLAQRGDVVLFDGSDGPALGLVYLNGTHAVFVGPDGLRRLPISKCRRAWRVG